MASCYRCGTNLTANDRRLRRRVKTGEWARRRYPGPLLSSTQHSYGMRIVCQRCAKRIDLENGRLELYEYLKLLIAIVILYAVILFLALFR